MGTTKKPAPKSKWAAFAASDGTFNFDALNEEQKKEFYKQRESIGGDSIGSPLTHSQRRLRQRVLRDMPRKGKRAQIVSLSIEKEQLRRAERLARSQGLSRSELFKRGIRPLGRRGSGVLMAARAFGSATTH